MALNNKEKIRKKLENFSLFIHFFHVIFDFFQKKTFAYVRKTSTTQLPFIGCEKSLSLLIWDGKLKIKSESSLWNVINFYQASNLFPLSIMTSPTCQKRDFFLYKMGTESGWKIRMVNFEGSASHRWQLW